MCLSYRKQNRPAFPELNMWWRNSKAVGILLGILVLCALPAHGQIVSYLDSDGRRVFINSDPTPAARVTKTSLRGFTSATGLSPRTAQTLPAATPEMRAA